MRAFDLNNKFFVLTGLWPYEYRTRIARRRLFFGGPVLLSVPQASMRTKHHRRGHVSFERAPQLVSAIAHREDVDRVMTDLLVFLVVVIYWFKMLALIATEEKVGRDYKKSDCQTRALCDGLGDDWATIRDARERAILDEYAERGRALSILYAGEQRVHIICTARARRSLVSDAILFPVRIASAGTSMALSPLIPKILDKPSPLPEPRANIYVLHGEFLVDADTHFAQLFVCDAVIIALVTLGDMAVDAMYLASCQHCCALYAIAR
ncbi:uncharacterized protein LOC131669961 [Phymastichus coffea]|uniref:uncharacterized protein LOC131669961 n=1 Tax=Phymastichus coffea TaxID=108790 RepID=UPI00273AF927|nr:uncharacterized protein LOC131669961 [Phymastichus coffea]